jgi:hypothetical protein
MRTSKPQKRRLRAKLWAFMVLAVRPARRFGVLRRILTPKFFSLRTKVKN